MPGTRQQQWKDETSLSQDTGTESVGPPSRIHREASLLTHWPGPSQPPNLPESYSPFLFPCGSPVQNRTARLPRWLPPLLSLSLHVASSATSFTLSLYVMTYAMKPHIQHLNAYTRIKPGERPLRSCEDDVGATLSRQHISRPNRPRLEQQTTAFIASNIHHLLISVNLLTRQA